METNIKNYNDMVYENRLVKFSDLISNKNNLVHKQLYNNALDKYINEWLICKRYIIEIELLENELKDIDDVEKENKLKKMKRNVIFCGNSQIDIKKIKNMCSF